MNDDATYKISNERFWGTEYSGEGLTCPILTWISVAWLDVAQVSY